MEIDRELLDIKNSLNSIYDDISSYSGSIKATLDRYERELNDKIYIKKYLIKKYLNNSSYTNCYYNNIFWKWKPNKKERAEQKRARIIQFFTNYDSNLNDTRIYWMYNTEIIKSFNIAPDYVYFNSYTAVHGEHHNDIIIDRPTLITKIFIKPNDILVKGDLVYSCIFLDISKKLETIINDSNLNSLEYNLFKKFVTFYNWCFVTKRYATIVAKTICDSPSLLRNHASFDELYKIIIEQFTMSHPNCLLTHKSRIYDN